MGTAVAVRGGTVACQQGCGRLDVADSGGDVDARGRELWV